MKWVAHFENKESIRQFDENANEILYQKVLDNIGKLNTFCLYNNIGDVYLFDLKKKEFYFNENLILSCNSAIKEFIYHRKCFLTMGEKKPYVIQCVGMKGENGECILEIDQQTQQYKFIIN